MSVDTAQFERKARKAVKQFWASRSMAAERQRSSGKSDQGERAGVTGGKNMDGFVRLLSDVIRANGLRKSEIYLERRLLTLPGFFRPTKLWDVLVVHKSELIAAIELKSQIGPSFGNNFNNRTEEAIGTALDLWTAYREDGFGKQPRPFVGWMILVEDCAKSRAQVKADSPHFPVLPEFSGVSYLGRYELLCQKLVSESLYSSAALIASSKVDAKTGHYTELSDITGLHAFVTSLAGHVAGAAARLK